MRSVCKRSAILDGKSAVMIFWAPFGGLGAMYEDYLRLIGKQIVHLLLVLTELFR